MSNQNVQDAKQHLKAAARDAKSEANEQVDKLKDGYDDVKSEVSSRLSSTADKLQKGCKKVAGYVKENPLTSLGIAAAVGVALASLVKRR